MLHTHENIDTFTTKHIQARELAKRKSMLTTQVCAKIDLNTGSQVKILKDKFPCYSLFTQKEKLCLIVLQPSKTIWKKKQQGKKKKAKRKKNWKDTILASANFVEAKM